MEVHPPDHPIHNWRDLFIHLGVITVGLFIALTLESFVEYIHHRHIVAEARENIRQEIEDNHKSALDDVTLVQKAFDSAKNDLDTIRSLRDDPKSFKNKTLDYTINFEQLDDSAWKTARETGALGFMPYKEVQAYSDLYAVQDIVNTQAIEVLHSEEFSMSPIVASSEIMKMPPSDIDKLLHNTSDLYVQLHSLKGLIQQLDTQYGAKLNK